MRKDFTCTVAESDCMDRNDVAESRDMTDSRIRRVMAVLRTVDGIHTLDVVHTAQEDVETRQDDSRTSHPTWPSRLETTDGQALPGAETDTTGSSSGQGALHRVSFGQIHP